MGKKMMAACALAAMGTLAACGSSGGSTSAATTATTTAPGASSTTRATSSGSGAAATTGTFCNAAAQAHSQILAYEVANGYGNQAGLRQLHTTLDRKLAPEAPDPAVKAALLDAATYFTSAAPTPTEQNTEDKGDAKTLLQWTYANCTGRGYAG